MLINLKYSRKHKVEENLDLLFGVLENRMDIGRREIRVKDISMLRNVQLWDE